MKAINFPVVWFSTVFTFGIITAHLFEFPRFLLWGFPACFLFLLVVWVFTRNRYGKHILFGSVALLCFFLVGYYNFESRQPKNQSSHYLNVLPEDSTAIFYIKITEILKPDTYSLKYLGNIISINNKKATGKILISVSKDSSIQLLNPDDLIILSSRIEAIRTPLNPAQFDYSNYMKSLGVHGNIRISPEHIFKIKQGKRTLFGYSQQLRNHITKKVDESPIKTDERAILKALLLGEKRDLSKAIYTDYASAGAIHILAVSGLHVGILYLVLSFLLRPLRFFKHHKIMTVSLLILCLWGFAFVSGLSPSVSRAVTMFSFLAFAQLINRPTNTLNTLFLSYLTLLVINPLWLFQVGFQLSYLAVFFIIWLQPKFRDWYSPTSYFKKKIWDIFSVTMAAQLGILPLSIYYFHQFPGLFLVTNLLVLPFLGAIMGFGLLIIFLAVCNTLPNWLSETFNFVLKQLNGLIHWIAQQDAFLFKEIPLTFTEMLGLYLILICSILILNKPSFRIVTTFLLSIILVLGIFIWEKKEISKNQFLIFHTYGKTILGSVHNRNLQLFTSDSLAQHTAMVTSFKIKNKIKITSSEKIPVVFTFNKKKILVLDSLSIYPKMKKVDVLVLTQSPKINLNRVLDSLKPKVVLADGSNYPSYVSRWRITCAHKKIPFYHTGKTGAYSIE